MAISLLLADDSPTIAKILTMALASEDYAVRSVLTADLAIAELRNNPPDIFLVDLTLPEKDGFTLCSLVKRDPALRKVRVALLASAFDPADPAKVKECQADSVIVKPFDPNELRSKLREMMNLAAMSSPLPPGSHVHGSAMGHNIDIDTPSLVNIENLSKDPETPPAPPVHTPVAFHESPFEIPPKAPEIPAEASVEKDEPLSENAQALAAFFNAEVDSHKKPTEPEEQAIDLTDESLAAWSSTPIAQPIQVAAPTSTPKATKSPESRDINTMFDTGGSSFRFSTDYTRRITRAFSGDINEHVPPQAPQDRSKSLFPHASNDSPSWAVPNINLPEVDDSMEITLDAPPAPIAMPAPSAVPAPEIPTATPAPTMSALSAEETVKIEQMIREEVHLVCREIVEKVAWEVIPELAENLIKKELQKVMEQLEQ